MGYGPVWIEISGELKPESAFRVGAPSALDLFSDMPVLHFDSRHGRPWIPGSTLRGVLRNHLSREYSLLGVSADAVNILFGYSQANSSQMGRLRTFDSIAEKKVEISSELRDYVRIEPMWGAAADRLKFDSEVILQSDEWRFPFRVVYEGTADENDNRDDLILLDETVRSLQKGLIRIGSRSGIGLGRFALEKVEYRCFDRSKPAGVEAWLKHRLGDSQAGLAAQSAIWPNGNQAQTGTAIQPVAATSSNTTSALLPWHRLSIALALHCEGPLLVKSPIRGENPDAQPVRTRSGAADPTAGRYYLPGSSLRGMLRAHAYRIADSQNTGPKPWERLFGSVKGDNTGVKGLLEVTDGLVLIQNQSKATVNSDHVVIDRITNAAGGSAKFDDMALDSPEIRVEFDVRFTDESEDRAAVALLLLAVRDLLDPERRRLWIGSQTTRGYGLVREATPERIAGSFHSVLRNSVPVDAERDESRLGRTDFSAEDKNAPKAFKALCAAFDDAWQAVRGRSVPA